MIGIVGLGRMGRPIAERLIESGEQLIVWSRTPGREAGLQKTELAPSPADVAAKTSLVLSVLADETAIEAVYFGPQGLLSQPLNNTLIVEMSTISPELAQSLETAVHSAGGQFLECPVGGTVGPARNGQLLGMAGGEEQAFAQASPVLGQLTRRLEHLGPVGSGSAMKLAINLPLMVYWSALGEALGLARANGVDVQQALDILSDSSGAIGAAKVRVPPIAKMITEADPGHTNFALSTGIKDMRLMEAQASGANQLHDVISAARQRAEAAAAAGFAELDCSLLAAFGHTTDDPT